MPNDVDLVDVDDVLTIDPLRLDREVIRQPQLYHQYATALADARLLLDMAASKLKVMEAELGAKIRKDPESYHVDKVTEASVAGCILMRPNYQAQQVVMQKARHKLDVLQAMVTALDHKKRSVTLMVDLHGMNYFADPKVTATPATRERMQEASKQAARAKTKLPPRVDRRALEHEEEE